MEDIDDSDVPDTGAVFTYGLSRFGDNEPGKFWIRNDKAQQIACGEEHTIVVVESGRAFTFGKNDWGQLGIGNASPVHTKPVCIKALKSNGERARLVACGRNHTIISTESGSLYGVGNNGDRQLGVESDSDTVPSPLLIQEDQDYLMLSAGGEMSAVLRSSGEVLTWGSNSEGQCGIGSLDVDPVATPTRIRLPGKATCISCGYYHAAAVLNDGRLFTWGEADGGKLGLGPDVSFSQESPQEVKVPERMRWVSCGNNHTVAVAASGRLYTWGEGPSGQLGLGEHEDQASEPREVKFVGRVRIKLAEAGDSHTSAVTEDGRLFCFGDARHGKLGLFAPDEESQIVWRPSEVLRFPYSNLSVQNVNCGGCHTILLGGWKKGERNDDLREDIVPATFSGMQSMPQPIARRRNRTRYSNGEIEAEPSRRLNQTLPPLRRPMNRDHSDEGFGSQSSTRNGDKVSIETSDTEEKSGKASFDKVLMESKFDNMLSLDDEEEENIAPPPRKSLLTKMESSTKPSPYALDGKQSKNDELPNQFRKRASLRDSPDEDDDEEDKITKANDRRSAPVKDEDDMLKESTKNKRRGRGGMFGKKSALLDEEESEDEEKNDEERRNVASSPRQRQSTTDHTTFPDPPVTDEAEKPIENNNAAPSEQNADSKPVRVGCGGGGGRSSNANTDGSEGTEKSKTCMML